MLEKEKEKVSSTYGGGSLGGKNTRVDKEVRQKDLDQGRGKNKKIL